MYILSIYIYIHIIYIYKENLYVQNMGCWHFYRLSSLQPPRHPQRLMHHTSPVPGLRRSGCPAGSPWATPRCSWDFIHRCHQISPAKMVIFQQRKWWTNQQEYGDLTHENIWWFHQQIFWILWDLKLRVHDRSESWAFGDWKLMEIVGFLATKGCGWDPFHPGCSRTGLPVHGLWSSPIKGRLIRLDWLSTNKGFEHCSIGNISNDKEDWWAKSINSIVLGCAGKYRCRLRTVHDWRLKDWTWLGICGPQSLFVNPCSCPSFLGSASTASGATANVLAAAWRLRLSWSCKQETISGRFFLKRPTWKPQTTRVWKVCFNWCVTGILFRHGLWSGFTRYSA